jgi:hypothetical protein
MCVAVVLIHCVLVSLTRTLIAFNCFRTLVFLFNSCLLNTGPLKAAFFIHHLLPLSRSMNMNSLTYIEMSHARSVGLE